MRVRSLLLPAALLVAFALAQPRRRAPESNTPIPEFSGAAEFHFTRLEYTDLPAYHRRFSFASRSANGEGWWMMDWPDADNHFSFGVQRLTRVHTGEPRHFRLADDRLFDHPWLYATQTGWWDLTAAETARLREYLLRGGFLVVDDFYGPVQWETFRDTMLRVLPGASFPDLSESDPILHVLYDIREQDRTFIPGTRHLYPGPHGTATVHQPAGTTPTWRAMHDPRQHLIVAINFNTDVGDAWEYADSPDYPAEMTNLAYRYGVNYLLYAMTH